MRSKANFKTHPIHPMLIPFPLAFFFGAFLFHLISNLNHQNSLWQMGNYLAWLGIGAALLAAIPGIIDYLYTVPPKSSAKKRATKHGLVNSSVVVLFIASQFLNTNTVPQWSITAIELVGVGLLTIGGWLGGTLVYRNQIGMDHRYAKAGKWKEEYIHAASGEKVYVSKKDELKVDQMKLVHINDKRIVVARTENKYVAFEDYCTHKGGSLAGGAMICGTVQCPWHGSQFDVTTGEVKAGPASKPIHTYSLQEEEGKIYMVWK